MKVTPISPNEIKINKVFPDEVISSVNELIVKNAGKYGDCIISNFKQKDLVELILRKNENLTFYVDTRQKGWGSSVHEKFAPFKTKIVAKGFDISEIIDQYSQEDYIVLKIDIEGMEYEVLRATKHLSKIKRIAIEVEESTEGKLKELLTKEGFKVSQKGAILYARKD